MPSGAISQRWTAENLTQAFTAINDKIGADPADYIELAISSSKVIVKAINPHKRENVDEYDYVGSSVSASPVDVSHNEPGVVEESAFKSETVTPAVLAQALSHAINDSGVEDGTISSLIIEKVIANDPEPRIQVNVRGPRATMSARYDLTGQLQEVV